MADVTLFPGLRVQPGSALSHISTVPIQLFHPAVIEIVPGFSTALHFLAKAFFAAVYPGGCFAGDGKMLRLKARYGRWRLWHPSQDINLGRALTWQATPQTCQIHISFPH